MKDHVTKLIVKARKKQDKDFKQLYKLAVKTIRRLKEPKPVKQELQLDLLECDSIDIIHYLGVITPTTKADYIFAIDKLLEFEYKHMEEENHPYKNIMAYRPNAQGNVIPVNGKTCLIGGFKVLTEVIRKQHNELDRYKNLKSKVMGLKE